MKIKKANGNDIRIENRKLVFSLIFKQPGISRPQITVQSKLSAASVGKITDELLAEGLVREYDSALTNVGRKPSLLQVCGENISALAIELDRHKQVCAIVDLTGKIHARAERDFFVPDFTPREICNLIHELTRELIAASGFENRKLAGVGIALPGLIDDNAGMVHLSAQFRWRDVPLRTMLKEIFPDMQITMDNEMNALALAESLYGELRNAQNAVIIGIGAGVGAGIIANGKIYRGDRNMAGEVGHIIMNSNGKMCECGKYGCLQTYIAEGALIEDANTFKEGATIHDILQAAASQEAWAISILDRFVQYTKIAISYITNLLNPSVVTLSGRLITDYPELYTRFLNEYPAQSQGYHAPFVITKSSLGRDGIIIGAAANLLYKVYNEYL